MENSDWPIYMCKSVRLEEQRCCADKQIQRWLDVYGTQNAQWKKNI